ncbi:yceJ [Symbiodinium necroappetens]|uniref:YceJ protein n=1 Tax=Symbiodinium necroappetens TaxID=1628268 RepID=A0A812XAZ1_9DINO|nr:yceJ [Symbiodinium necroappetens]
MRRTMRMTNSADRYGAVAQILHWVTVALFIAIFALAWIQDGMTLSPEKVQIINLHKSVGVTILALAVLRLAWRWYSPPPSLPEGMAGWERRAAHASHVALYVVLLAQPLIGILHSAAANFPVVVFGLFTLPALIGPSEEVKQVLESAHHLLARVILALLAIHILAALRHHFVVKDDVLTRMLRVLPALAPALAAACALWSAAAVANDVPLWTVGEDSRVGFVATQSGAPVEGAFEAFTAEIAFDPDNLAASRVAVVIDIASVNSESKDRDDTIRSAALFDVAQWPEARFMAEGFTALGGDRFEAAGNLTMRDVTLPVVLPFTLTITEEAGVRRARASGELEVSRLDYGVGQGLWADTSVVGEAVVIRIDIAASRAGS